MSEGPASLFRVAWFKIVIAAIVAVLLGVIAFYGYQYYLQKNLSEKLPESGSTVMFSDRGMAETFSMTQFSFTQVPPEKVGDILILESKQSPMDADEQIILAQKEGGFGVMLAKRKDAGIEVLLDDGTNKSDLLVTPEGVAVFAVATQPAFLPDDIEVPGEEEDLNESDEVEEGSATGPVVISVPRTEPVAATAVGGLFAFDLKSEKTISLGAGKSPRLSELGSVVAIAPEGVVDIDAVSGARFTVVQYRGGDAAGSALSEDGSIAALRREGSSTVEFFRVSGMRGIYLGQIFSVSPMYGTAILGEEHIFVRTGKDTVALYALSDDPTTVQPNFAELGLLLPN